MLILKQNAANTVPTPPAGKGTIFLNPSDDLAVKTADGTVATFPTASGANTQVYFNDDGSFGANANFVFNKSTSVLTITGNVAATRVLTDNLLYANGTAWDLSDPGGSNTQIQFNDDESFGGSAAFVFDKSSNLVTVSANLNANNLNATTHITSGNVWANSGTIGALTLKGEGGNISNIQGGNVSGAVASATSATTAGTVTTAAQPNITSVGTLSSLAVTANVAAGNLTTTGVLTVTGTGVSSIAGNLDMTSNTIINLATPTNATDAATKQYVDDIAQGLHTHDSCNAATSTTLATSSGGTVTYDNGTSGVGATLTTTGSYTTIDGVTLSNGMRILVKNEANAAHNGIYDRTSSTVLTRSTDFDTPAEMAGGDFTFVTAGTLYDNTGWVMTDPVTTVGTTNVNWVQFSGAGTYTAGTGLTLTGSQFSITNTAVSAATYGNGDRVASFTVNAQGQLTAASDVVIAANAANLTGSTLASGITTSSLTTVGTLGSLAVTGNATAGNVYANSGTIGASSLTGTLTTAAQPNITSVGTLTGLTLANAAVISVGSNTNVGTFTGNFSLSAGSRLNATYADLAEKYVADAIYEPGTVLAFSGEFEVTLADAFDSTRVAGVVTTNPAYTMNNECEGEHVATIALQGRVPVKVSGTIAKGDLLVSANNGHAVANNEARAGTIIGKSLENFTGESGVIEVAVGRF